MNTNSIEHSRPLSLIGAPSSAGAYGPGQELAPAAFRRHRLASQLSDRGLEVVDRGDGQLTEWIRDEQNSQAANVDVVARVIGTLATTVSSALADNHNILVLGGDCTVELGVVAGAIRDGSSVGLLYVDLDADLNTPETGDGILDWMGMAHILGITGANDQLATIAGHRPMLDVGAVRLIATNNISAPEQDVIDRLNIEIEPLAAVIEDPTAVVNRIREWAKLFDRILVHVDFDVLDYDKFPIAENTDLRGGLDMSSLSGLLSELCDLPNWRALTLTEINPSHAPDERQSFQRIIEMLGEVLGGSHRSLPSARFD